jgi:hypothetical protein
MSSLSSESSSLSSGLGPSGMAMSLSLSSSLLSLSDTSDGAVVSAIAGGLTPLGIRHPWRRHAKRVVCRVVVDAALGVAQRPVWVVEVCRWVWPGGAASRRLLALARVEHLVARVGVLGHVLFLELLDVLELALEGGQALLALVIELAARLEVRDVPFEVWGQLGRTRTS